MYTHLLLAVDGSPRSRDVAYAAAEIAKTGGGKVHVIHVVEEVVHAGRAGEFSLEEPGIAVSILNDAAAILEEASVDHTTEVRHAKVGHIATDIIKAAHESSADLIVMGTHGATAFGHMVLGSTAYKVLHLSDLPVLVLPSQPDS